MLPGSPLSPRHRPTLTLLPLLVPVPLQEVLFSLSPTHEALDQLTFLLAEHDFTEEELRQAGVEESVLRGWTLNLKGEVEAA